MIIVKRPAINTARFSEELRKRVILPQSRHLLITNFSHSAQAQDLTVPPNCGGYGRIRRFRRTVKTNWPPDPLPMLPACKALGLEPADEMIAQVFQLAGCNWRCWYCFVDYKLLSADRRYASFLTPQELVSLYLTEENKAPIIDLSGGHPELAPEWVLWMMQELQLRRLNNETYLWSDDNLSTDFLWKYLTHEEIDLICSYRNYGRVCCFKGFDPFSFSFNTRADPDLFGRQFRLAEGLLSLGLDLFCYATFTTPNTRDIDQHMSRFVDMLQELDPNLPLRTVPLEITIYAPVRERLRTVPSEALANQYLAAEAWTEELTSRYSTEELEMAISEVPLKNRVI